MSFTLRSEHSEFALQISNLDRKYFITARSSHWEVFSLSSDLQTTDLSNKETISQSWVKSQWSEPIRAQYLDGPRPIRVLHSGLSLLCKHVCQTTAKSLQILSSNTWHCQRSPLHKHSGWLEQEMSSDDIYVLKARLLLYYGWEHGLKSLK